MTKTQINKTCISCGLEKPLNAFLQIAGPRGTSYGNICATCRGSGLGKSIVIPEAENEDHNSSTSTGLKIDSKTKIHLDAERKQLSEKRKELEIQEIKKEESETNALTLDTDKKQASEKKHRQEYIEPKNAEGFLNYKSKQSPRTANTTDARGNNVLITKANLDNQIRTETLGKEESFKSDEQAKAINTTDSYIDPTIAGQLKYEGEAFKRAKTWLGKGAAISTFERQFLSKQMPIENKTNRLAESPNEKIGKDIKAQKTALERSFLDKQASTENNKNPIVTYLQENLQPKTPNSGRRR
jgi:hypothetical protein